MVVVRGMASFAGAAPLLFATAGVIRAEESPERQIGSAPDVLEEVVVTARRREERLQDVPISLSVLSDVALDRLQIDDVSALEHAVPNLSVTPWPGSAARATITMRGQVEPDRFPTVDPAVGVYLDGVYIARIGGANLDLVDMQRVEVLRGPQGTLYGRNTIGGAINLVPKRPGSQLEGALTAGVGNYDRRDLEVILNVPLAGDKHAVRFAAMHTEHSGYGRNTLLNRDLNVDDTDYLRTQLRLAPAERWDLNLSFDYTRSHADVGLVTLFAAFPPLTDVPAATGHPDDRLENYANPTARTVQANRGDPAQSEVWGGSGILTIDLAQFTLKALSAYRSLETSDGTLDVDGTPYDLFTISDRDESQSQWSHELQAYGDALDSRLSWIGGLHYFEESGTYEERFHGIQSTTLISSENLPAGTVRNESLAVYAQLVYALSQKVRITGGVRYNEDRRQLTSRNKRRIDGIEFCGLAAGVRDAPDVCQATLPERDFSYVPWTLGLDFKPAKDALLYAKVSRGHRSGGYNFRGVTGFDPDTFEPEQVTAYEIGTRARLFNRRVRVGLTWYRSLFDDIQVRTEVALPGGLLTVPLTQNAGEARIEGGELEVEALLGSLQLTGALGITHGEYTELDPRVLDVTLESQFVYTSDTTASVAADLPITTDFGAVHLHADYSWRDDEPFATDAGTLARQEDFGLLSAVITVQFEQANIELQLWARNLTDERYIERAVDLGFLVNAIPGDPRTYGVSLTYRFDDD